MNYSRKDLRMRMKIWLMLVVLCAGVFGQSALACVPPPPPPPPPDCSDEYQDFLDAFQDLLNALLAYGEAKGDVSDMYKLYLDAMKEFHEAEEKAWDDFTLDLGAGLLFVASPTSGNVVVIIGSGLVFYCTNKAFQKSSERAASTGKAANSAANAANGAATAASGAAAAAGAAAGAASAAAGAAAGCMAGGGTGGGEIPPFPPIPPDWVWPYSSNCPPLGEFSYPCGGYDQGLCQGQCAGNQCSAGGSTICQPALVDSGCYYMLAGAACTGSEEIGWLCECSYMLVYSTSN
jgi:hypothetical protein